MDTFLIIGINLLHWFPNDCLFRKQMKLRREKVLMKMVQHCIGSINGLKILKQRY